MNVKTNASSVILSVKDTAETSVKIEDSDCNVKVTMTARDKKSVILTGKTASGDKMRMRLSGSDESISLEGVNDGNWTLTDGAKKMPLPPLGTLGTYTVPRS